MNNSMNPKQSFLQKLVGEFTGRNVLTASAAAAPVATAPVAAQPAAYNIRGTQVTDRDLHELRNVMFGEVSNRTPDRQEFESRVIANTALNRIPQYAEKGKKLALADVLAQPNQYQAYGGSEYNRIAKGATTTVDKQKLDAIDKIIGEIKAGKLADTTDGAVFYQHDPKGQIWLKPGGLYK